MLNFWIIFGIDKQKSITELKMLPCRQRKIEYGNISEDLDGRWGNSILMY